MPLVSRELANRLFTPEHRREEITRAQEAVLDPEKLDSRQLIEAWAVIGECHKFNRESQLSKEAYLKAIEVIRTLDDKMLLGRGYEALGNALFFCNDYEQAISYYRQAAEIFEDLSETEQLVTMLSQIAYAYAEIGQRNEERRYLNIAALQATAQPVVKATLLERIALSLGASGEYEEAIRVYEQALSILESEGFKRDWQKRLQVLAQLYSAVGDEASARRIMEQL